MDEPFAALDYFTRAGLQQELLNICHGLKKTVVFVTHNIDEAILLGDRIVMLERGQAAEILLNPLPRGERDNSSAAICVKEHIMQYLKRKEI